MNWLRKVMIGRYGIDQLSLVLLILSILFSILSNLTHLNVFYLLSIVLLAVYTYRTFSKQISKRYEENRVFLKLCHPIQKQYRLILKQLKEAKTHCYYKCPSCRQTLRVPRGRGKICITCPKCSHKLHKKT